MTNIYILPSDAITNENNQLLTASSKVAEAFGKLHKNVIQKIENLDCSDKFASANFSAHVETVQAGAVKRKSKVYQMTKDGFMFLVMGFTGKKAALIKEAYINAFNQMANKLYGLPTKPITPALPQHTPHPYFDTDVAFSNVNHTKALAIKDPCIELGSTIATCSLNVARIFDRPHDEIIDLIRNLKCSTDFKYSNFSAELIGDITSGQFVFYITKDGLTFLMMDLNLGADIKEGYIREFNAKKRAQLYGHPTPDNTRFLAPLGQAGDQLAKY
ncbi:Rha family transcriptional regulator [Pseudoalteromonas neustonica]|uniref:Rha family transcriptional regulator n=1 Tax=Pseudoalteromonas neustonica TaxID=1840331 RepID=UPI0009EE98CA|nr:Rha family transcriptional regulator [Pseudoalteromonas neustonica]